MMEDAEGLSWLFGLSTSYDSTKTLERKGSISLIRFCEQLLFTCFQPYAPTGWVLPQGNNDVGPVHGVNQKNQEGGGVQDSQHQW